MLPIGEEDWNVDDAVCSFPATFLVCENWLLWWFSVAVSERPAVVTCGPFAKRPWKFGLGGELPICVGPWPSVPATLPLPKGVFDPRTEENADCVDCVWGDEPDPTNDFLCP